MDDKRSIPDAGLVSFVGLDYSDQRLNCSATRHTTSCRLMHRGSQCWKTVQSQATRQFQRRLGHVDSTPGGEKMIRAFIEVCLKNG